MKHVPISGPWITDREVEYVADAARNAWYANANEFNDRFEKAFAEYLGVRRAVSLPSCTSAIHLSLAAMGIGPGDEVIVPDVTWIASAAPINYVGATPVFVDINPETWCLSVEGMKKCITPKTKAVIPVNLYGGMPDWDGILELARKNGIAVIEDAAESIGSEYKSKRAGSMGDTGVFSFHGSKTLTTGEGGMLVTDRDDLYDRIMFLRDHGRVPGDSLFNNHEVAFKYKMSSMQAALGLAQLERVDELVKKKREIFSWYREELADLKQASMNIEPEGTVNSYWMVTLVMDKDTHLKKEHVREALKKNDIDTRPFFNPLSSLPAYSELPQAKEARAVNTNSYRVAPYGLNLPSALNLDKQTVKSVCSAVKDIIRASR